MSIEQPILRVRKDHTCISLGLIGLDFSHMCDKCNFFQRRATGMEGRKPGKLELPKCEKPWYIRNGITNHTPYRLIEKKRKAIEILSLYNYKLQDDDVDKNSKSRLISMSCDYRKNYKLTSAIAPHKTNTSLNDSSHIELSLKPSSILEENMAMISHQPIHVLLLHKNLCLSKQILVLCLQLHLWLIQLIPLLLPL